MGHGVSPQQTRLWVQFQCQAADNYLTLSEHDGEMTHVMCHDGDHEYPGEPPPVSTPASWIIGGMRWLRWNSPSRTVIHDKSLEYLFLINVGKGF